VAPTPPPKGRVHTSTMLSQEHFYAKM